MMRFYATAFTVVAQELARLACVFSVEENEGRGDAVLAEDMYEALGTNVRALAKAVADLPLSRSVRVNFERLGDDIMNGTLTSAVLKSRIEALKRDINMDLTAHTFLLVEEGKAEFYEQPAPPFGSEVANAFADAEYDIAAASRCIALDEWTASVFHLMRVHEFALRHLGRKLRINVAKQKTIEFQDWQVIITAVEGACSSLPKGSRAGSKAAEKREFYNEIAGYLFHVKEAWRVPVMHARAKYDPREAMIIWENTKALMQRLATDTRR